MGLKTDLASVSTDAAKLASDQGVVASLQSQLATAQGVVDADNQAITDADALVAADLAGAPYNGSAFVANPDGSITLYQVSPNPPGFTIVTIQPATD